MSQLESVKQNLITWKEGLQNWKKNMLIWRKKNKVESIK